MWGIDKDCWYIYTRANFVLHPSLDSPLTSYETHHLEPWSGRLQSHQSTTRPSYLSSWFKVPFQNPFLLSRFMQHCSFISGTTYTANSWTAMYNVRIEKWAIPFQDFNWNTILILHPYPDFSQKVFSGNPCLISKQLISNFYLPYGMDIAIGDCFDFLRNTLSTSHHLLPSFFLTIFPTNLNWFPILASCLQALVSLLFSNCSCHFCSWAFGTEKLEF